MGVFVATREEREAVLTGIMRSADEKTANRLKAIELLGKMNGDYIERVEHSGGIFFRWANPVKNVRREEGGRGVGEAIPQKNLPISFWPL